MLAGTGGITRWQVPNDVLPLASVLKKAVHPDSQALHWRKRVSLN